MLFLIGVIIFILFIIIVYFFIKSKIKKSLEQFGFNNINEIYFYMTYIPTSTIVSPDIA